MSNARWSFSKKGPPSGAGLTGAGMGTAHAGGPAGQVRRLLIVDDERDLADMAEALLTSQGLDVVVAYSAMEALRILGQDEGIDAVFSDVMMPGMNGLQLADAISDFYPRIKIVLTSGFTLPAMLADRERTYLFAAKPYRMDTIMTLLRC